MKIAIMQPYFIPYVGYFRLLHAVDLFIVYDCVQFPRRGWVHRNKLYTQAAQLEWLTLPLSKQPVEVCIKDLLFRENAQQEWPSALAKFPGFDMLQSRYPYLYEIIRDISLKPVDYITKCLHSICSILDIPFNIAYSSALNLPKELKGQDRIIAIAKHFNATDYLNAPGGRQLYEASTFSSQGIKLHFLPEYQGEYHSIAQSLTDHSPDYLKEQLASQC